MSRRTHELLTELAERRGASVTDLLDALLEQAPRQEILSQYNARMGEILLDPGRPRRVGRRNCSVSGDDRRVGTGCHRRHAVKSGSPIHREVSRATSSSGLARSWWSPITRLTTAFRPVRRRAVHNPRSRRRPARARRPTRGWPDGAQRLAAGAGTRGRPGAPHDASRCGARANDARSRTGCGSCSVSTTPLPDAPASAASAGGGGPKSRYRTAAVSTQRHQPLTAMAGSKPSCEAALWRDPSLHARRRSSVFHLDAQTRDSNGGVQGRPAPGRRSRNPSSPNPSRAAPSLRRWRVRASRRRHLESY